VGTELVPVAQTPLATTANAADLFEAWLAGRNANTVRSYIKDIKDFCRFLSPGSKNRDDLAAVEAFLAVSHGKANQVGMKYRAHLNERGLAPGTVARRLSTLRSMVTAARRIGRIAWSLDVDGPRSEPYRDTRGPGLDGWRAILKKAGELATTPRGKRDMALCLLMHDLGLRRGECVALDLVDVELNENPSVAIVGKGKTEQERLTLTPRPCAALRDWIISRGSAPGPLFTRLDTGASVDLGRLTGDSVARMVTRLGSLAGLSRKALPHGLRHQGITRLLDLLAGDVRKVQRFSRHAKVETVMRYDDARRDDAGALAQLLGTDD
jgi:integrase/recombinase XerC